MATGKRCQFCDTELTFDAEWNVWKCPHGHAGADAEDAFFLVSADTMTRAQFYDCKLCRAIVLDRTGHTEFHNDEDVS